ncbi:MULTISPECIES: CYTH and CHAD domain-containing protein [Achromobacter]|uniref:CYTH and CHAD domain-containing protein n=1 Tax=Achromobacter spanius TaxID=217203 RepID=A0ABY8GLZ8_9BURK|nr:MULTISPECIES: CYTH and CHAD domain-containing protein [Achromobacter]WAI85055.1 CYTH and CHAD domain-containing protein [Achromobacter spanius]WEX95137.1 CYTH and CHAD domain-containing protein [Achromobacter sp. SS2-2022]WFP05692.1 CYTH and CHAD domain-containing protein [Achromobacter spanius]
MSEQELKLHVPAATRQAVLKEVKQREATRIRLHAMYFDTPERELARARIAIRLRQEGKDWVQTLKMPGINAITRIELNHPRPGPVLDLSVYAGTEVEAALSAIKGELGLRYETDVLRQLRKVRTRYGTVELAYDTGILRAGALELPISELEFELVSGRPAAIFAVARGWQQRHSLVLDPRSKSERGDALAQLAQRLAEEDAKAGDDLEARRAQAIAQFWAPRGAASVKLREDMTAPQALGRIAAECLDQIARNAAVLAEVDTEGVYRAGNSEHVHQLRVGVRRLRSAWKLFEGWVAPLPDALLQGVRTHFAAFGANRDQDVLNETVAPALLRAGMPVIPMEAAPPEQDAQTIAGGKAFQAWLLDLLEWSLDVPPALPSDGAQSIANGTPSDTAPEPAIRLEGGLSVSSVKPTIIPMLAPEPDPHRLRKQLARRLHRWHSKVADQGTQFAKLDIPTRHELRKRGKRLRYSLAFAESLLPTAKLRGYRKLLSKVQDVLGEINDLAVAKDYYESCTATHPQAWFALGWISARLEELAVDAQKAFDALAQSKPFWR